MFRVRVPARLSGLAALLFFLLVPGPGPRPLTTLLARAQPQAARVRVDGRRFVAPDGSRFRWRGITAFRLLEMEAHGRGAEARSFLDFAASHGVTVVRVLAMADVLFHLSPSDGRAALPAVLSAAREKGLLVEVVALADTDRLGVDLGEQVSAVGATCARFDNCVLEIANEPWARHAQRPGLGAPSLLGSLRALVPGDVPVSLGAAADDTSAALAGGDFVTVHLARGGGRDGWKNVLRMPVAEALSRQTGKPVVDDEPIGAAGKSVPGRRDDDPGRWLARGLLARLLGLGSTFHYEGGLQARVPVGREAECFDAWRRGLDALPPGVEEGSRFVEAGQAGAAVVSFNRSAALGVCLAQGDRVAWVAVLGATGAPAVTWSPGWREAESRDLGAVRLLRGQRRLEGP